MMLEIFSYSVRLIPEPTVNFPGSSASIIRLHSFLDRLAVPDKCPDHLIAMVHVFPPHGVFSLLSRQFNMFEPMGVEAQCECVNSGEDIGG